MSNGNARCYDWACAAASRLVAGRHDEAVDGLTAKFGAGRCGAVGVETRETRAENLVAVFHGRMRDRGYTGKQLSGTPLHCGKRALGFGN